MGSVLVVCTLPSFDDQTGMRQTGELMFVQTLISKPSVKGFDVGVLVGFVRFEKKQLNTACVGPCRHGPTAELFAVVSSDRFKQASRDAQLF